MSRKRNWCFTLNNPLVEDRNFWLGISEWEHVDLVQYVVLQEEEGANGTQHYQGYIEMKKAMRMSRMKSLFSTRNQYHWEARMGTQAQAIAYCKKADTRAEDGFILEWGHPKRTGKGGNFKEAVLALKDGMGIEDASEEYPEQFAMWHDRLEDYYLGLKGVRDWAMDVIIYVGASGTGKSYTAQQQEDCYVVPWPTGGRWWWPHYRGEYTVIMDEFRHQIKMDVMLKMMDRYIWHLEAKGRSFQFTSRRIIITTNVDPRDWYPNLTREKKEPLARRIREFATIWDFQRGIYPNFNKVLRTGRFDFNAIRGFQMAEENGYAQYDT